MGDVLMRVLRGFQYDGDGKWSGGTIYDPNDGRTYKSKMELRDASTLRVRGYVGAPIFGRTSIWTWGSAESGMYTKA